MPPRCTYPWGSGTSWQHGTGHADPGKSVDFKLHPMVCSPALASARVLASDSTKRTSVSEGQPTRGGWQSPVSAGTCLRACLKCPCAWQPHAPVRVMMHRHTKSIQCRATHLDEVCQVGWHRTRRHHDTGLAVRHASQTKASQRVGSQATCEVPQQHLIRHMDRLSWKKALRCPSSL